MTAATFARLGAKLARELKPFGITSKPIRVGDDVFKGYEPESFEPVWERYLAPGTEDALRQTC